MPKMVEYTGDVVDKTDLAWKFIAEGSDEADYVWIPKILSKWRPNDKNELDTSGTMSVTAWFAHKEGL